MAEERFYEDVKVGDTGRSPEVAVTREMIRAYADLTGDHCQRPHGTGVWARSRENEPGAAGRRGALGAVDDGGLASGNLGADEARRATG